MLRVLRFFKWKAEQWTSMVGGKKGFVALTLMHVEGVSAYAMRQAKMYTDLSAHFERLWSGVPAHVLRMQNIIRDPSIAKPGEFETIHVATKPIQHS